jgi:hypothetical protein
VRVPLALAALLAGGLSMAGCAQDAQGTPAQQLEHWVSGTGFQGSTTQVRADVASATRVVATATDPAVVHTVCGVLLVDVEQANANLPTPDLQATSLLGSAYESLGAAAHDCYDVVGSPAKRAAFATARLAGLTSLAEACQRIEAVTGQPLGGAATTMRGPSSGGGSAGG